MHKFSPVYPTHYSIAQIFVIMIDANCIINNLCPECMRTGHKEQGDPFYDLKFLSDYQGRQVTSAIWRKGESLIVHDRNVRKIIKKQYVHELHKNAGRTHVLCTIFSLIIVSTVRERKATIPRFVCFVVFLLSCIYKRSLLADAQN